MSKITIALEAAVATVLENTPQGDVPQTNRQRVHADRAFAAILKLIAPRIRHFIRQYGLAAHWDDAEQCCAIGVHRAIQAYESDKAQFTTFVNWQIRGELQSLRFRLMTDQRPSAKKVSATTVSLNAQAAGADGEDVNLEAMIEDELALDRTEAGASDFLAGNMRSALMDRYVDHLRTVGVEQLKRRAGSKLKTAAPRDPSVPRLRSKLHGIDPVELAKLDASIADHRDLVERRMFDDAGAAVDGATKEQMRQISKRAAKTMAELAVQDPRFAMVAPARKPARTAAKPASQVEDVVAAPAQLVPVSILLEQNAPHNRLASVAAVHLDAAAAFVDVAGHDAARESADIAPAHAAAMLSPASSGTVLH